LRRSGESRTFGSIFGPDHRGVLGSRVSAPIINCLVDGTGADHVMNAVMKTLESDAWPDLNSYQ
jgi:hypothetical protein